jgi:hypothetical protein
MDDGTGTVWKWNEPLGTARRALTRDVIPLRANRSAFAEMMPILKWLALRASETLGIASLTPTYDSGVR